MKKFTYILIAALSVLNCGCNDDLARDIISEPIVTEDNAYVDLCITVAANNCFAPGSAQSRAEEDEEQQSEQIFSFQPGIPPYEDIHSLRVIMLDDNKVEYNEFLKGFDLSSTQEVKNIRLRTKPGGKRRLYLIANEAALYDLMNTEDFDFSELAPGDRIFPQLFSILTINASKAGLPLFDNGMTYVPMTEFFDVDISEIPEDWTDDMGPFTQMESMFVTRTAVKFSFIFQDKPPYKVGEDYQITDIKIHSTALSEYLFPHNLTYYPPKNLDFLDRQVVNFSTPSDVSGVANINIKPQEYEDEDNYSILDEDRYDGILKAGDRIFTYDSPAYFPETKITGTCTMDVTVKWLDNGDTETFEGLQLNNLPYGGLPRNTHVLVIISAGEHKLNANVRLVPYIGVELEPLFGFDKLVPGDKSNGEEETPENPETPETENP